MRVLITGIAGFAGSHLAELLVAEGWEVAGTTLEEQMPNLAAVTDRVKIYPCDLRIKEGVAVVLKNFQPEGICHLAAFSSVGESFQAPFDTFETNVIGTLNLLESAKEICPESRLLVVTSSDIYGKVARKDLPLKETMPLNPTSPYAASKAAVDFIARQYHAGFGLPVIRVRPFNHTGPRQRLGFVVPDFAHQIARIEAGLAPPTLRVGNLSAQRDLSDVRDIVRGYRLLLAKGRPGEVYHLSSGKAVSIRSVLKLLLTYARKKIAVATDHARLRPQEIPILVGDSKKAKKEVGYRPGIPLTQTLKDTLDFWRRQIKPK